jgi:hypothetical protein
VLADSVPHSHRFKRALCVEYETSAVVSVPTPTATIINVGVSPSLRAVCAHLLQVGCLQFQHQDDMSDWCSSEGGIANAKLALSYGKDPCCRVNTCFRLCK